MFLASRRALALVGVVAESTAANAGSGTAKVILAASLARELRPLADRSGFLPTQWQSGGGAQDRDLLPHH